MRIYRLEEQSGILVTAEGRHIADGVEILIVERWKGFYSVMPGEIAPPSNPFVIAMKVRHNQRKKDALYPRSCR
jgi:hypothetical protein